MHLACHVLGFHYYILINPKVSSLFTKALDVASLCWLCRLSCSFSSLRHHPYLSKMTVKFHGAYNACWSMVVHGVKKYISEANEMLYLGQA